MPKFLLLSLFLPLFYQSQNNLTINLPNEVISQPLSLVGSNPETELPCNAVPDQGKVLVIWSAVLDQKATSFQVEKSSDGLHFNPLCHLYASGNSAQRIDFSEVDYQPFAGTSYYRIKALNAKEEVHYSEAIEVKNSPEVSRACFPFETEVNSVSGEGFQLPENNEVLVVILDASGKEAYSKVQINSIQNRLYATDTAGKLSSGNYLVMASSCDKLYSQRLTIK